MTDGGLATLHPAYFALVMATGIVSIACALLGLRPIGVALLWANSAFYVVLWMLTVLRIVHFRSRVAADLSHHGRAVGFFTAVAATCVLGSQWFVIADAWRLGAILWATGIVLWATITYSIFALLTVKENKPSLADGINGGWLVSVVAAQSVSVLGCQIAAGFGDRAPLVLFFCLAMWLGGGMLYIWIISLIFYRYTFFAMHPSDLAPPYWINMGAVAISTLAGSLLVLAAPMSPVVRRGAAVRQRTHVDVLGHRDVVDSDAADSRRLETRVQSVPASLRSAVLGRGVSARHVHGLYVSTGTGDRGAVPVRDPARVRVRRPGRLDADDGWTHWPTGRRLPNGPLTVN
jgi:tellurite resistance protein TehA-like permease